MAKSRYKFFETVWNDDIQHNQKGQMNVNIKELFSQVDYILYNITLADQYRPDIISSKFYGDPKYWWVLVYANEINDSPQGFEVNRKIKIPNPTIIGTIV